MTTTSHANRVRIWEYSEPVILKLRSPNQFKSFAYLLHVLKRKSWMLSPPTQKCRYRRNETKDSHDQELGTQKHVPRAACFLLSRTFWWQLSSMDIHFSTTITMTTDDDDLTCEPSKNLRVLLFRCNLILILVSGTFCYFSLGWLRVTLSFPS